MMEIKIVYGDHEWDTVIETEIANDLMIACNVLKKDPIQVIEELLTEYIVQLRKPIEH